MAHSPVTDGAAHGDTETSGKPAQRCASTRRQGGSTCTSVGSTCNSYKSAPAGQWTVVATGVKDGTQFQFYFASDAYNSGVWAG